MRGRTLGPSIRARVTSREWQEWTFQLSGGVEAVIRYEAEAVGRERVWVNNLLAEDTRGDAAAVKRRSMNFRIPVPGTLGLSATLDVRDGRIFGNVALRLTVDGNVVYQDRAFARLDRQLRLRRLPVPAGAPSALARNLPVPGESNHPVEPELE